MNNLENLLLEFIIELKEEVIFLNNELKEEKTNSIFAHKKIAEINKINLIIKKLNGILDEYKNI